MIFITGPLASGKRTFAASLNPASAAYDIHEDLRGGRGGNDLLERLLACDVVTGATINEGIVPATAEGRAWRDNVGHLYQQLAHHAECVVVMTAGIPRTIKGTL